jgi:hypothetical protein
MALISLFHENKFPSNTKDNVFFARQQMNLGSNRRQTPPQTPLPHGFLGYETNDKTLQLAAN